jgi:hypothetical protein
MSSGQCYDLSVLHSLNIIIIVCIRAFTYTFSPSRLFSNINFLKFKFISNNMNREMVGNPIFVNK